MTYRQSPRGKVLLLFLLWWSGVLKMRGDLPKQSLCQTSDLRGGPVSRIEIYSTCVPVGWRVALFGGLGSRPRCVILGRGRIWDSREYDSLGEPVGAPSINSVDSRCIYKFSRWLVARGLSSSHSGVTSWPYRAP